MGVEVTSLLVRQLVEAYKAYKICHLVGLKKEKSHCYSLRFLQKSHTKNRRDFEKMLALQLIR